MKRHRGLKRYYKKIAGQKDFDKMTWLNLADPTTWFDNWHIHFDRKGYGNNSFKRRKPHLDKLFPLLARICNPCQERSEVFKIQGTGRRAAPAASNPINANKK